MNAITDNFTADGFAEVARVSDCMDDDTLLCINKHTTQYRNPDLLCTEYEVTIEGWDSKATAMLTTEQLEELYEDIQDALYEEPGSIDLLRKMMNDPQTLAVIEAAFHALHFHCTEAGASLHTTLEYLGTQFEEVWGAMYHVVGRKLVIGFDGYDSLTVEMNTAQPMHPEASIARRGARYFLQVFEAPDVSMDCNSQSPDDWSLA
jgi:hypothetical protein